MGVSYGVVNATVCGTVTRHPRSAKECPKLHNIMSAVTIHMWKQPSIGWVVWLFMLRKENEKDLRVSRGEYHQLLLFKYILKK